MGRKWGDRKDGTLMRDISSMHYIMPLMYPNRCDNEAFMHIRIDLTNADRTDGTVERQIGEHQRN